MKRIVFDKGKQRTFLDQVITASQAVSLRGLRSRGINVFYSTLKNYYVESRKLPEDLYLDLCELAAINPTLQNVSYLSNSWGQAKGGKKSKRKR